MRTLLGCLLLVSACGSVSSSVGVTVEGDGEVTSTPAGIACPPTCFASFASGENMTLVATPGAGSSFTGWSGGCPAGRSDCSITLESETSVSARFAPEGARRWLITSGSTGAASDAARGASCPDGSVVVFGSLAAATTIAGMTGGPGMYVAKIDRDTQQARWVRTMTGNVRLYRVASDAAGDVFVAGALMGSVDFGNGPITAVTTWDTYVVKYRGTDGGYLWSRIFPADSNSISVALDPAGDAYVAGGFRAPVDFGAGSVTPAADDMFLARYSGANGNYVWARSHGSISSDFLSDVEVDSAGNVVVVGLLGGNATIGSTALVTNNLNVLLAKFDGTTGMPLFAKQFGGTLVDGGNHVELDSEDQIIVFGSYDVPADVGGASLPGATGESGNFVAKYTTAGAHVWSRGWIEAGLNQGSVDSLGDVVCRGSFLTTVDLGDGVMVTSAGGFDALVVKLRGADGTVAWAKRYGGTLTDFASGMFVDELDRPYVVGEFTGFAEFDGATVTATGLRDLFVLGLEP